jgi:hypothetical protein
LTLFLLICLVSLLGILFFAALLSAGTKELEQKLLEQQEEIFALQRELNHFLKSEVGEREKTLLKANASLQVQLNVLKEAIVGPEVCTLTVVSACIS